MHVDMDAFYASVELRRRPELRGRPVIVGGYPRGVVLSATYEARAFGVRSGMASSQAIRLAPNATFLSPDFDSYSAVSAGIGAVFRSVTSIVEAASIDEAYLDVTGARRMFGSPVEIGEYVRAVVADEQQISCSVGIGPTKFVAKVASKQAKPDGLVEVPPDRVEAFLHPLPVEAMWGVGVKTAERLHNLGITTVGDLAHTPRGGLRRTFGPHAGWDAPGAGLGSRRSPGGDQRAGAEHRLAGDLRGGQRRGAGGATRAAADGRQDGRPDAQGGAGRPDGDHLRSVRGLRRADAVRDASSPTAVTDEIYAAALGLYERLGSRSGADPPGGGPGRGPRAGGEGLPPAHPDRTRARMARRRPGGRCRGRPVRSGRGAAGCADPSHLPAAVADLAAAQRDVGSGREPIDEGGPGPGPGV